MATLKFSELKFGEAAAEVEAEKDPPDLLVDSFVDKWDVENKLARGDAFLLIGPKGQGNRPSSSISESKLSEQMAFHSLRSVTSASSISPRRETLQTSKIVEANSPGESSSGSALCFNHGGPWK